MPSIDTSSVISDQPNQGLSQRHLEILDDLVTTMFDMLGRLSVMLDQAEDIDQFCKLFTTFSRCLPHLGRLLRDQQFFRAQLADDPMMALSQAIAEIGEEYGFEL